ncbi:MAG: hypothetical protein U5K75_06285 [Ahrensia sp.]|nr:hypothetical protein [Ahrensia sp.]
MAWAWRYGARLCKPPYLRAGASGNLRAITAVFVMALTAWATFQGFLVPARDWVGAFANTSMIGGNDLVALAYGLNQYAQLVDRTGFSHRSGFISFFVTELCFPEIACRRYRPAGLIAGGWYLTYQVSQRVFDPVLTETHVIYPSVCKQHHKPDYQWRRRDAFYHSIQACFSVVVAGAFLSSVLFGSFKFQKFSDVSASALFTLHHLRRINKASAGDLGGRLHHRRGLYRRIGSCHHRHCSGLISMLILFWRDRKLILAKQIWSYRTSPSDCCQLNKRKGAGSDPSAFIIFTQ